MLKVTLTLCALAALTLPAFGQQSQEQQRKEMIKKYKEYEKRGLIWAYDPFRNETTIMTKAQQVYRPSALAIVAADLAKEDAGPTIAMLAGITYRGEAMLGEPPAILLAFQMNAKSWQQLKSDREIRVMFEVGDVVLLG